MLLIVVYEILYILIRSLYSAVWLILPFHARFRLHLISLNQCITFKYVNFIVNAHGLEYFL